MPCSARYFVTTAAGMPGFENAPDTSSPGVITVALIGSRSNDETGLREKPLERDFTVFVPTRVEDLHDLVEVFGDVQVVLRASFVDARKALPQMAGIKMSHVQINHCALTLTLLKLIYDGTRHDVPRATYAAMPGETRASTVGA